MLFDHVSQVGNVLIGLGEEVGQTFVLLVVLPRPLPREGPGDEALRHSAIVVGLVSLPSLLCD